MTPTVHNLADLQTHLATGKRPLGAIVYWTNISNVRVPRSMFRAELERMGLGEAVGRDPKAEACLNMAAAVASHRQKKNQPTAKIQLKEKGALAVYAVLMRRDVAVPGETPRVRYIEEARVAIPRDQHAPVPQTVTATDVASDDARDAIVADMVAEYTDLLANIRTQECSEAIIAAMSLLGGLSLRTGVYFVPAAHLAQLDQLRAFLSGVVGVHLTVWSIAANDANVAQSRHDARAAFLDKVGTLVEECKRFAEAKADDLSARSINVRIARFKELEGQAMLYADILGDKAEELRKVITDAQGEFRRSVLGDDLVPLKKANI